MPGTPKSWFITGASTGLGEALATLLLDKGEQVAATFRKPAQAEEFTRKKPGYSLGVLVDVPDAEQLKTAVQHAVDAFGRLDVVVNNAGYGSLGSIEEISEEETQRQFDVNVFGPLRVVRAALPHLRAQKSGYILNITSGGGLIGLAHAGIYNGSKFALEGLGESLAAQLKPSRHQRGAGAFPHQVGGQIGYVHRNQNCGLPAYRGRRPQSLARPRRQPKRLPIKAAEAMYQLVRLPNPPQRLLLGAFAYQLVRQKLQDTLREIDGFAYLGEPTDF